MRILFISKELIGGSVVQELIREGSEVKLYIENPDWKACLDGIAHKVESWEPELDWVGKNGLIIFDDIGWNDTQETLRSQGYSVVGGNNESDKLELNRQYFQDVLSEHGVKVLPSFDFASAAEAMIFVQEQLGTWVVKQNSHIGMLNYVGQRDDAKDVMDVLKTYQEKQISPVHLQKRVYGYETGVARYFNGSDWVGPIEVNLEYKSLCNGDIGPLTAEMGTIMWYDTNEELPLFKATLAKIKDYLIQIQYKGDIDINCIVNAEGVWPLEATMRFGTPSTELQCDLHRSPWSEFLKAVADGESYTLDYHSGYGVVISVATPPFPYAPEVFGESKMGTGVNNRILFTEDLSEREFSQIRFMEVSATVSETGDKQYYLAGEHGYALYVTGRGETISHAKEEAYNVVRKIIIPRMFYRTDIGDTFIHGGLEALRNWGWI